MVTINPEIVQFISHLALTGHLTVMYKDSTNIGVNLTKGKPLTNPRNNFIKLEKVESFTNLFVYVCFYLLLLYLTDRQICLKIIYHLTTLQNSFLPKERTLYVIQHRIPIDHSLPKLLYNNF